MRALVFPGQGSQSIGMGKELFDAYPVAKEVFEEVDNALSQKLSTLIFEGNMEELSMTENTQPALMAVSVAAMRSLEHHTGKDIADLCKYVAGHSLGEYSALCAAGAISLTDTAKLLRTRGQAMQSAVPAGEGKMAALLGLDFAAAEKVTAEVTAELAAEGKDAVCSAANDNASGQVVISGHAEAIERAVVAAKEAGAKRAVILPVSAPFHSVLMQPAADVMEKALAEVTINEPKVSVIANVLASDITAPDEIRKALVSQVTGVVRWTESVSFMKDNGVDTLVEIGAGKVLSGLARRIDRSLIGVSINNPNSLEDFLK
ncbi:MAG: ACP S-malonyltransferase [Alphaproteobacteria bacterium]|nr:ACP S-malonyltransferase [Alphaproteobacteria bacterium]